jgi:hypothetical protein
MLLDQLEHRNVVCKVKWQPTWDSCSVQTVKEDEGLIEKIKELFPKKLKARDRPNIIRVFKMKFDALMNDLTKKHVLGKVLACN